MDNAKRRKQRHLDAINAGQAEIAALEKQIVNSFTLDGLKSLKLELKNLQDRNLKEPSF